MAEVAKQKGARVNLTVVIPVWNERENLPALIAALRHKAHEGLHIQFVICDDGSTDGTLEWLQEEALQDGLIVLSDGKNHGPGSAFETGFLYVINYIPETDFILTLEGDGTADLSTFPFMLERCKTADVVLASVYTRGGGFSHTNWKRLLLSRIANGLTRLLLRLPYRTLTSFYRLYRLDPLKRHVNQEGKLITERGFICQVELLYKLHRAGNRIVEVPTVLYTDRRKGLSKMKLGKTMKEHIRFLIKMLLQPT
jgi:dolichol-phosphate mannosyltransferase